MPGHAGFRLRPSKASHPAVTPLVHTGPMAFGQQSGPPANHRQVKTLTTLLQDLGYADFRDARGAFGLTQRQAAGKFTVGEADALIERLEMGEGEAVEPVVAVAQPLMSKAEKSLTRVSSELLAAELQRRGWVVMEP